MKTIFCFETLWIALFPDGRSEIHLNQDPPYIARWSGTTEQLVEILKSIHE